MIITKTTSKYKVGCKRGYGIDVPDLVFKLNLIVDKERSTWGDTNQELEEGDVFLLDGTIFGIDHDRLVQVVSETGPLALERIYNEQIKPELEFSYHEDPGNTYSWVELVDTPAEASQEYTPQYTWMKIWDENFSLGRNLRPKHTIEVEITDSLLGFSRKVYLGQDYRVRYREEDFSEEEIAWYVPKILSWFYSEVGRAPMSEEEKKAREGNLMGGQEMDEKDMPQWLKDLKKSGTNVIGIPPVNSTP